MSNDKARELRKSAHERVRISKGRFKEELEGLLSDAKEKPAKALAPTVGNLSKILTELAEAEAHMEAANWMLNG